MDAFASPETQAEAIFDILRKTLLERANRATPEGLSVIDQISAQIKQLQQQLVDESKDDIFDIEKSLSEYIGEIFVGFAVSIDTKHDQVSDKAFSFFSTKPVVRMGPVDGHMAPLDKQGSGARRTLLWSALKLVSERAPETAKSARRSKAAAADTSDEQSLVRPHVLLLDEPEICLHPDAIRDACRVLYDLASEGTGWQVMVTTHSPAFLDMSRDNTTIVRVDRRDGGIVSGTTVYRPSQVQLTHDEKEYIKLLNHWDPYVAEFFFGGSTIIVEGDTEYSAFREIIESDRSAYRNVHIVRGRGKFVIPALIKIMNHFGSKFAVLHDSDSPDLPNGNRNPAWNANEQILKSVKASLRPNDLRLATCVPNFEMAIFGEEVSKDKPYNAVRKIKASASDRANVKAMLDYLIFKSDDVPACLRAWDEIEGLRAMFEAAVSN